MKSDTQDDCRDDAIVCWSCDEIVSIRDVKYSDGFCPCCNKECEA